MAELIIVFREVFEASLIIGILYTYLKQTNNKVALKYMWKGVLYALIASILGSILFQLVAGGFHGKAEKVFEGIVMIIAALTLGSMIIWMAKNQNIAAELKEKAEDSLNNESLGKGILWLAFISVFREGIETILFLYGIIVKEGSLNIALSLIGALMGIAIGYLIFIQGRKIPVKTFFNVSSVLLIFVASGMFTYGVHEFESAGLIPYFSGEVEYREDSVIATRLNGDSKSFELDKDNKAKKWSSRIWDINPKVINHLQYKSKNDCVYNWKNDKCIEYPLLHDKGSIGGFMKGFFGYNGDPSLIEFIAWLFSLVLLLYMYINIKNNLINSAQQLKSND